MEPIRIEVPKFVRVVKLSEKQQPKYFEWNGIFIKGKNKTLPVRLYKGEVVDKPKLEDLKKGIVLGHYLKGKIRTIYGISEELPTGDFKGKIFLCKIENGQYVPILSNPKSVGKPKNYLIRGQDIYNGYLDPFSRGKVMDAIKQCYMEYVKNIPVITEYPIKIEVEFHHTIHNPYDKGNDGLGQQWDIDNFVYPYMKAFPDLLVSLKKLRNDDRLHITQPPHVKFFPIEDSSEMKFVFIISKDDRPEIANNETFKSYHKNKNTYETEDGDLCKDDEPFGSVGKMTNEDLEETIKIFKNPEDGIN